MASAHNFDSIPIIDLSLAATDKPRLLAQLRHALTDVGFLYVVNHGVPATAISDVVQALPRLFALPPGAKEGVALRNSPHFLGYSGDGAETTGGKTDRREQFEFATELGETWRVGSPLRDRLRGPNQWPSAYPELRPILTTYIAELSALGERFLELVAQALSLPPTTFHGFLSDQHRLKLVHYPPPSPSPVHVPNAAPTTATATASPVQGVGPHKDSSGWWTFLLQASPPHVRGLQALNRAGRWIDVPPVEGSFVVNIGQAFEAVTGGLCPATTHRVVLEGGDAGTREGRFSVPFFQGVRRDLTKREARGDAEGGGLKEHFERLAGEGRAGGDAGESAEGRQIDSPFLKGKYDTWGESQLRTKIRSHRDVGKKWYGEVYEMYVHDDE